MVEKDTSPYGALTTVGDHCFQFPFFPLYLGGSREEGEKPHPASQLDHYLRMGAGRHLMSSQGPDAGVLLGYCSGGFDTFEMLLVYFVALRIRKS